MIEMVIEQSPEQAMESFSEYYVGMAYSLEMGHDCLNIIETTSNQVIGQLRRNEQGLWYNIPLHLYKTFSDDVLSRFDLVNRATEFDDSLYSSIYMAYEYEDLSKYLFYVSMCVCEYYNIDINKSNALLFEEGRVFIDGIKNEWVENEGDVENEDVIYLINIIDGAESFSIKKVFESEIGDVQVEIKLEDLNKAILDELKR